VEHPTYPSWVLDDSPIDDPEGHGEHVVQFFKRLRHPNSPNPDRMAGLPMFWERILRKIYGPRDEDGERLIRDVFIMIGRGARKSSIAGGLALYHTTATGVRRPNGQVLVGAASKKQGFIVFKEARKMALATPGFIFEDKSKPDKIMIRGTGEQAAEDPYIKHIEDETIMSVQSADGDLSHGTTPSVAIYDELHVFKSKKLWSAIQTGLVKVKEPLRIVITTAGRGQQGLAWEEYQYAKKVATGEIVNPHYLPVLFEPPSQDSDWRDRNLWAISNPGLSEGFPDVKGLASAAEKAADSPSDLDDFKQYNLNFWLAQSLSPFVSMTIYDDGDLPVDLAAHEQYKDPCWVAVDLGVNHDLSAVAVCWRDPTVDAGYEVSVTFFCPDDNIDERSDGDNFNYRLWAEDENHYLIPTPGNITDYNVIQAHIENLTERFNVQEIAFDPARASQIMTNLTEAGHPVVHMQQGWKTMMPAINELERSIIARRFSHGGNPVLRWNFENISVHTDSAGNRTFHKGKSKDRIDGAQATAMAVGRAHANAAPDAAPIPFYLQPGFDPSHALGLVDESASPEDAAAAAARDAEIDKQVRKMLGID
jgi:phage terminase large subunit-like protein